MNVSNNTVTKTKKNAKTKTNAQTSVSARAEISKGAVATFGAAGAIVGLWSFASLIGGLVVAGGPISLVQAWFGAAFGM